VLVQNGTAGLVFREVTSTTWASVAEVQRSGFATVRTASPSRTMSSPVYGSGASGGNHGALAEVTGALAEVMSAAGAVVATHEQRRRRSDGRIFGGGHSRHLPATVNSSQQKR